MLNKIFQKKNLSETYINKSIKKIKEILEKINLFESDISMIESIIEMNHLTVRDVMIPRVDVQILNVEKKRSDLMKVLENTNYSRLPVYEGSIDNIIGILHIRDLFKILLKKTKGFRLNLNKIVSEPYFIPEAKKLSDLLREFQVKRQHLAVVVDEYGGFAGIITFEDILEVFIGDIQDEFDIEQEDIRKIDENVYSIDARTYLDDFNEEFKLNLDSDDADSLGGYVIMKLGYIPKMGQSIDIDGLKYKIIAKRKNSLLRLRVSFPT